MYGEIRDKVLPYFRLELDGARALFAIEKGQQSQNRLQFYRRIKAVAESSGIAQAFEEWKQAVAYSKKLAQ